MGSNPILSSFETLLVSYQELKAWEFVAFKVENNSDTRLDEEQLNGNAFANSHFFFFLSDTLCMNYKCDVL